MPPLPPAMRQTVTKTSVKSVANSFCNGLPHCRW
jgi:hypothetical protein